MVHLDSRIPKREAGNARPTVEMPELSRVWATEGKYLRKNLILALISKASAMNYQPQIPKIYCSMLRGLWE
ncbi:hypothetical protein V8E54_002893 [Elaphomyces granulatus]